jgi:hypothetical protein
MTGKEQLVSKVGEEDADKYINIIRQMMDDNEFLDAVEDELQEK